MKPEVSYVQYEFHPHRLNINMLWYPFAGGSRYVYLTIRPEQWEHGFCLIVRYIAQVVIESKPGYVILHEDWIYDNHHEQYAYDIGLLATGQILGIYAQNKIYTILKSLIFKTEFFKEVFPHYES